MRAWALLVAAMLLPVAAADHTGEILFDPATEAGLAPTPSEVQAAVDAIRGHPWATVHQVGESLAGEPIFAIEITDPDSQVPMEDRVVTFIMTQQHGNEPAGTPAALRVLQDIQDGSGVSALLQNQILILMPQSNPDGALDNRRTNEDGEDINRDHVDVGTPEAKAIHKVLGMWDVHQAYDHHEYGGAGIGYPVPIHTYDFDVTTMWPNHGNVREPTRAMSLEINYDHIKPRLAEHGFSHGDYGVQTVTVGPVSQPLAQTAGGPDPGILRNNYGLNNVAGLLIESYIPSQGDNNPFQTFERRVESHYIVMETVLMYGSDNPQKLIDAKRESERLNLEEPMSQYMEGERTGPMPAFFRTAERLEESFAAHHLPLPFETDKGYGSAVHQHRGGLIAAMLHQQSSRQIAASDALDDLQAPEEYLADPQLGGLPEEIPAEPLDQEASAPLLAIALLGALLLAGRRR